MSELKSISHILDTSVEVKPKVEFIEKKTVSANISRYGEFEN